MRAIALCTLCLTMSILTAPFCRAELPADAATDEEGGWLFRSPFADVKWPEVKWRPMMGSATGETAQPSEGFLMAPIRRISSATQSAMSGVQSSWNRTVDRFKITGEPTQTAQSKTPSKPGFFQRMFYSEPEPSGSETMQEFVAQERPGLTR